MGTYPGWFSRLSAFGTPDRGRGIGQILDTFIPYVLLGLHLPPFQSAPHSRSGKEGKAQCVDHERRDPWDHTFSQFYLRIENLRSHSASHHLDRRHHGCMAFLRAA